MNRISMEEPMVRIDRYDNADDIIGKVNDACGGTDFSSSTKSKTIVNPSHLT